MKRSIWILLALLAGLLVAERAEAHIVPVGVGTQTWIDVRPRKVIVRFNLGFSSLLGLAELRKADTNQDTEVSAEEEQVYLGHLIERVLPQLRFHLDGKPLAFKVLNKQAAGLRGKIAAVAFDTFFDLEADVPIGAGPHELVYYEGTYEGEVSQQILYVVTDRANDFGSWDTEQKAPGPPPVEADGALTFQGRDVTVRFEFLGKALERDKAEALIEPCLAGLQDTADGLATNVARSAEKDLSAYAGGPVRLGVQQQSIIMSAGRGFKVSAPTASDRDGSQGGLTKLRTEESEETAKMFVKMRQPFTVAALLFFLLWGALHATGPGHGKTMVAAYLLGTKGRLWDAARLGAIVTFTHTFTLYTFGLGLVFLVERLRLTTASQDAVYQRSVFLLTLVSGIGLCFFGLMLAWRRHVGRKATAHAHDHGHDHAHDHAHDHSHAPALPAALEAPKTGKKLGLVMAAPVEVAPPAEHAHGHDGHTHTHDGHTHSHGDMSEDEHAALHAKEASTQITSFKDLLSLGIAGGIVPCPAGVTLIVGSIGLGQSALKTFAYLNAFSIGLGAVLVAIAGAMVFSRKFLEQALAGNRKKTLDLLPVVSAVLVSFIGLGIAYEAFDPNLVKAREKLWGIVASSHATAKAK